MSPGEMTGIYRSPQQESVFCGGPWGEVLAVELEDCSASRVLVAASTQSTASENLKAAMWARGSVLGGMASGIRGCGPREDLVGVSDEGRSVGAEYLLAIGELGDRYHVSS